jgi:predicted TIM-barrel fold metal-dependent hydrolase
VASVDLTRPMAAVAELRRCVETLGFRALRVLPWLWGLPPDDRRYYPLLVACCELDVTFCTQVGHAGPLRPSAPGRPIPHLDNVALEFPELRIVGGHIGVPWLDEMISLATKYPNVYIDTSAYISARYPATLVDYVRGHGRRKVLFGSNHPPLAGRRLPGRPRPARPGRTNEAGVPARQRRQGVRPAALRAGKSCLTSRMPAANRPREERA